MSVPELKIVKTNDTENDSADNLDEDSTLIQDLHFHGNDMPILYSALDSLNGKKLQNISIISESMLTAIPETLGFEDLILLIDLSELETMKIQPACDITQDFLLTLVTAAPQLQVLDLPGCKALGNNVVLESLKKLPKLKILNYAFLNCKQYLEVSPFIGNSFIQPILCNRQFFHLSKSTSLQNIYIGKDVVRKNNEIFKFSVKNFKQLKYLRIDINMVPDLILKQLIKNPILIHLEFKGAHISKIILPILKANKNLRRFRVDKCTFQSPGFLFPELWQSCKKLSELILVKTNLFIGGNDVWNHKELEVLIIDHASMVLPQAISGIKTLTKLEYLGLCDTNINDDFLESVSHLSNLKYLDIGECWKITNQGLDPLKKLINLRSLHLRGTQLSISSIHGLIQYLKKLQKLNLGNLHPSLKATDLSIFDLIWICRGIRLTHLNIAGSRSITCENFQYNCKNLECLALEKHNRFSLENKQYMKSVGICIYENVVVQERVL